MKPSCVVCGVVCARYGYSSNAMEVTKRKVLNRQRAEDINRISNVILDQIVRGEVQRCDVAEKMEN